MQGIYVDELLDMIRKDEGRVLKIYRCPAGKRSIGYGYNIDANPLPDFIDHYLSLHGFITIEMAEYLLDRKVSQSIAECKRLINPFVWEALTPHRRMVLIMMAYNMGSGFMDPNVIPKKKYFKDMMAALKAGDVEGVCREMKDSAWYRELGGDPEGTNDGRLERSEKLIAMFRKG